MNNQNYTMPLTVAELPGCNASAVFRTPTNSVFREEGDLLPLQVADGVEIMPWGGDNQMPFDILNHIEADETMATCMMFNSEICYGSGLLYHTDGCTEPVKKMVADFFARNDMATYFMGVSQDFKYFGFAVSVIILSKDRKRILSLRRKEACYCRFAPAKNGRIPAVYFANWRRWPLQKEDVERIELLDANDPLSDLEQRLKKHNAPGKYAIVSRIPTVDSTYYPMPYYGALFKGKWYDIKQLIGVAKEAKLRNTAPIKYQIEIADGYWERVFREEGITDPEKMRQRMNAGKQMFIDYLTGVENSGKVLFSNYYTTPDGRQVKEIMITKVDSATQGGDWSTDIQEAVNMICFTLRVHSNLLGSVPGKAQTNNSGSDKRELYTISQALQKPYRDILFGVHRLIIAFNKFEGAVPCCPFIQLTTLDEHRDIKETNLDNLNTENNPD